MAVQSVVVQPSGPPMQPAVVQMQPSVVAQPTIISHPSVVVAQPTVVAAQPVQVVQPGPPMQPVYGQPGYVQPSYGPTGSGQPTYAPPSYVPPQPTIEEARQQMHSLLDDAFALVSPSSQGSSAPLTLTGVTAITGVGGVSPVAPSSPPLRPLRQWGSSSYPVAPAHSPFSAVSMSERQYVAYISTFCSHIFSSLA